MRVATRSALLALTLGATLFARSEAHAQVQMFEEVPSVEELRKILVPESVPGLTRRIIITPQKSTLAQPASLSAPAAPSLPPSVSPPPASASLMPVAPQADPAAPQAAAPAKATP